MFDIMCSIDGAWGVASTKQKTGGGIGGTIKNKSGTLTHVFTGPVAVHTSQAVEIEAIVHVLRLVLERKIANQSIVICSDSTTVIEEISMGLKQNMPVAGPLHNLANMLGSVVHLNFVPRDLNANADSLAKCGINRPRLVTYWAPM